MAWTSPLTAVANAALTAAQWNASVRDNLNETAVGKATAAGRWFVTTGANQIAEREIATAEVLTSQTTTSTTYTDLATVGPAITMTTATKAIVFLYCAAEVNSAGGNPVSNFEVTGATTRSPTDTEGLSVESATIGGNNRASAVIIVTGLTAGSNTFRMKYKTTTGTATFQDRRIMVMGL